MKREAWLSLAAMCCLVWASSAPAINGVQGLVDYEPYSAHYVFADLDGDGLMNGEEDLNGDGVRQAAESDILLKDTDADGIEDGVELLMGSNPVVWESHTDADADSLPPGAGLDPNDGNRDYDGDQFKDGYEYAFLGLSAVTNSSLFPTLGDATGGGGRPTNADVITLRRILALYPGYGIETWAADNCDVSRDAQLTNTDVILLRRWLAFYAGWDALPR